ncbi:hypothetical protein [Algoriphagus sp. CAU 1675]|uniref:hypothetical protein n=1 Tax=Algoriphagus sp. CAU 1675 TaxID=3032597 RepID=UPI0023DBFC85|nr:hypothetical protein [Algoriphagus sp. CAU 1675]MDF2158680.1 hypothetical protein [Algoriphagus sp. CAU 1675]
MQIDKDLIFGRIDMKNMKRLIFLFGAFLSFASTVLYAQEKTEKVTFTIPKSIFFTDEKIWIDASVSYDGDPAESKVLYAELLDKDNRSWVLAKMPLEEDGQTLNFLELNERIPSGNYLLRVFTRISPYLDLNEGLKQRFVTVLNPKLPPQSDTQKASSLNAQAMEEAFALPKAGSPSLSTLLNVFGNIPKEKILEVSLSVENPYLEAEEEVLLSESLYEGISPRVLLPELFGPIVHARINAENPDTTQTYFLSVHGQQSALFTDKPDESGNLYFDMGGFRHWDHLLIQVEDGDGIPDLELQSPAPRTSFKQGFQFPELVISPEDSPFLSQLKIASALEPYFSQEYRNDSVPVVTGFVADQVYNLDDYTRFETVETVTREYITGVVIRRRDKRKEFRILNVPADAMFDENPLMMVDALPVFDSDMLINFNPKFFKKVEVLNREFYLNDRSYPGVLSFSSYENNFGLYPVPDQVLYENYSGVHPFIQFREQLGERVNHGVKEPDYRSVLLWQIGNEINPETAIEPSDLQIPYKLSIRYLDQNGVEKKVSKMVMIQ